MLKGTLATCARCDRRIVIKVDDTMQNPTLDSIRLSKTQADDLDAQAKGWVLRAGALGQRHDWLCPDHSTPKPEVQG